MHRFLLLCALLLAAFVVASPARAAECIEIGSQPSTIVAPGNYCLSANLTANSNTGGFITIGADDVDFDCRGYTLHNTATETFGNSYGVFVSNHRNVHVRNCHITGNFAIGIYAFQNNGVANQNLYMRFTDNFIVDTAWYGILAYGSNIEVSNNQVHDVGGRNSFAMGIRVGGSNLAGEARQFVVSNNLVVGTHSVQDNAYGIYASNPQSSIFVGNEIVGTDSPDALFAYGIRLTGGTSNKLADNHVTGVGQTNEVGIATATSGDTCYNNYIRAWATTSNCDATLGNY